MLKRKRGTGGIDRRLGTGEGRQKMGDSTWEKGDGERRQELADRRYDTQEG